MTSPANIQRLAVSCASLICAIVIWHLASLRLADPELLPSPGQIIPTFVEMLASGELWIAVRDSMSRVIVGYAAGTAAGIVTGILLGRLPSLDTSLGALFEFLKGIPPIAVVPLVIIWFGIGEVSKYIVIGYIVWIVVAVNTAVGAREVPRVRIRAGQLFGLSVFAMFRQIVLPSCLIYVVSGMRSAIGFAFVALVSAELIAANTGLGQIVMNARFSLQTAKMIVGLLVLGCLGSLLQIAFDKAIQQLNIATRFQ